MASSSSPEGIHKRLAATLFRDRLLVSVRNTFLHYTDLGGDSSPETMVRRPSAVSAASPSAAAQAQPQTRPHSAPAAVVREAPPVQAGEASAAAARRGSAPAPKALRAPPVRLPLSALRPPPWEPPALGEPPPTGASTSSCSSSRQFYSATGDSTGASTGPSGASPSSTSSAAVPAAAAAGGSGGAAAAPLPPDPGAFWLRTARGRSAQAMPTVAERALEAHGIAWEEVEEGFPSPSLGQIETEDRRQPSFERAGTHHSFESPRRRAPAGLPPTRGGESADFASAGAPEEGAAAHLAARGVGASGGGGSSSSSSAPPPPWPAQLAEGPGGSAAGSPRRPLQLVLLGRLLEGDRHKADQAPGGAWAPQKQGGPEAPASGTPEGAACSGPMDVPTSSTYDAAVAQVAAGGLGTEGRGGLEEPSAPAPGADQRTTVMVRNLPNNYTRSALLDLIDSEGFAGRYDFLYMPIDFRTHAALGYAFINLVTHGDAVRMQERLNGFCRWTLPSSKVCSVGWSHPHQGLESHISRYRNSPLMHEAVPDAYRPILFINGVRAPFPPPTRKIKPPRQGTQRMLV